MKKLILLLFCILSFTFAADVKPFIFNDIPEAQQQATWDELMKYKLWGTEYFSVGNGVIVPDESGRNGTNGNLKGTGSETLLGGPIIVTGDINVGNGYTFPSGPTVANSFTMGNLNNGYFGGTVCLADTNVSQQFKQGLTKGGGELTNDCSTLPKAVGLSIPSVVWPDSELHAINVPMHGTGYIDVPAGEGSYDIYLSGITMDQESKLYIRMPDEGRLTRIFVNGKISLSNHAVIQTMNGSTIVSNDDYGGNLMFYTTEDLTFSNTDYCIRQGTYISAKTFRMVSNVTFAGQLLGNELVIGDNVDGKNFLYVPFDPPIINLGDPKTNALGNFVENDKDVEVPIFLDTLAPGKVSFNYCFILNENATIEDFNIENYPIKECGKDSGLVIINEGNSVPTIPVKINVKDDGKTEGTEVLGLKIYNVSGAALPGNKKTHVFTLTLSDGDLFKISTDGLAKDVPENKKDTVLGQVQVLGGNEFVRFETTNPKYTIDSITGKITLNIAYDYEVTKQDTIKIIAKDTSKVDTVDYVINVLDVNENPIILDSVFTFNENNEKNIVIGTIKWDDIDKVDSLRKNEFVLVSSTDKDIHVSIDGQIITDKVFDYENSDSIITIVVRLQDQKNFELNDEKTITIKLKDVNEAPIVSNNTFKVNENYKGVVDTVKATDPEKKSLNYNIKEDVPFKIDNNGIITCDSLDFETKNTYDFTVIVDDGVNFVESKITVKVQNVNEPVYVDDQTFTIPENKTGNTKLGNVNAKSDDTDAVFGTISYSVSDTAKYFIDKDGNLFVKKPFDYETKNKDTLKVYITDGFYKDTANIIVDVTNINEGINVSGKIENVKENVDIGTIVGVITAKDSDNVDVTYSINTPYFKIDPVTGVITSNVLIDYEDINEYPVKVTIVSKDSSKKDTNIVIKIVDVNEAPELKESILKIDENTTGEAGTIIVIDDDKNTDFLKNELSIIDGDSTKFKLDNNKVIVKTPLDYEQDSIYTIKVKVQDKTDPTLVDTMTYVVKVNNVFEKPEVKDIATNVDENKTGILDTLKATDPDGDKLKYEVVDNTNIKVDSNGVISIIKPFDYETDSTIIAHIVVTDPTGLKDTATISLKVNDVNEPHKVSDETITIPEDTTKTFKSYPIDTVKVSDPDLNPKHKFELIDTTNTFKIDSNGVITVIKPLDYETVKEYNVKVIVSDSAFADTASIKIKVNNIDEKSNVQIVHVDTRDSIYTETDKPIYTNDKNIEIHYTVDGKSPEKPFIPDDLKEGENKIEICDIGEGKDTKACDTVTVWYSNKTPVITVATIDKNKGNVNNITIIDEPDGNQYVNSKNPEIKVTVKDPTPGGKKDTTFNIKVDLKTVDIPVKSLTNKTIEPIDIDLTPDAKHEVIGKDSVKVTYYDPIAKATVSYVTNSEGKRINDEFTVSYVEKVNGQDVTISYTTDSYVEVKSNYSISYSVPQGKDTITVSYQVDSDGKIQKTNGNVGYTISYSYTNEYGNTGTSEIQVVLDDVPPKVEIYKIIAGKDTLYPTDNKNWTEYVKSSAITVFWTVDGKDQDTLTLQGLKAEKINPVVRCYQDKANNQTCDTVMIYAKGAKEIEIKMAYPVTKVDQDRVDSFYAAGGKYNPKKPIKIIAQDASEDKLPEPVGIGIKIGLALPILNQNGGMPSADDLIQTVNGVTGIVIDGNGNVITDAIAEIRDANTKIISADNYIENYCTAEYKEEVRKRGIENVPFYDMKYSMHVWIFNNNAEYVNDFNFEYTIDENQKVDASGMLNLMVDWLAAKDGYVKAKNNKNLGTGAYLVKMEAKSISTAKCSLNADTQKGTKIKKTEYDLTNFGYKRPITK